MKTFKEKNEKSEEPKQPEITNADIEKLRENLKPFSQRKINDKLYGAFEQYLQSIGVISFKEDGSFVVNAPNGYTRMSKINAKLELREYYSDKDFMEQNPEAKTAFQERIAGMREKLASKMKV